MCGIAGAIAKEGHAVTRHDLESMVRRIAHRGPDDEGILIDENVGLGHRRLSILDLSPAGHQPMTIESAGLSIVFNGEIYNYLELREELRASGARFYTETDTEVILIAYSFWGESCVNRFNGMWAFAIYDRPRSTVFLSRDRFGVKPLYYCATAQAWYFGSEIRQLLPFLPGIYANKRAVEEFIFAGVTESRDETFFNHIRKLPGGYNLRFGVNEHSVEIERYYDLSAAAMSNELSMSDATKLFRETLSDSVALRLRADVPVGTCLSGGLDSSSVATLAAGPYRKIRGEAFRAITAVSQWRKNDESEFAQLVASHSGMEWISVMPTYDDFVAKLSNVVRAQEEPFAGPSVVMQYCVMETARRHRIPVLLDGQGGDETLLGYERYYVGHILDLLRREGVLNAMKAILRSSKNNSKMSLWRILSYIVFFGSATIRYKVYSYRNRYLKKRPAFPSSMRKNAIAIWDTRALQKLEIESGNLPALLRYEDKNAMWHAVETRLPFMDYRLVETSLGLPNEYKIFDGWTKYILRRAMSDKLPASITWRKNKFGFEAPSKIWLQRHAGEMYRKVCSSKLLLQLSDLSKLKGMYAKLDADTRWRLYSVALWEEEFGVEFEKA